MHTASIIAMILFAVAAVVSTVEKAWPVALIAAGLAAAVAPAALQLT